MINDVEWDKIYDMGYTARCNAIDYDKNPHQVSDDYESEYGAWNAGWQQADNDCYEGEERRFL